MALTTENMLGRAAKEGQVVKRRQTLLENRRHNLDTILEKVGKHINPLRTDVDQDMEPMKEYGNESFDGTGMSALNIASNGIYGNMISPAIRWFMNTLRNPALLQIRDVKIWLQNVDEHLLAQFNASNWYDESFTWIKDTWASGTGFMYPYEDVEEGGFNFLTLHPGQCYIIRNAMGRVVGLHRKFRMQLQQMADMFGKDRLPIGVQTTMDADPFRELEMIHAVYPNKLFDSSSVLAIDKRFTSIWVLNEGANDDEAVLRLSGMDRFRFIVNHYERGNDEDYGRSPGMYALYDIMGHSLMTKHMLGAAERSTDPPFAVPDDLDEEFNLLPRGITYYTDPARIPIPLQSSGGFDFAIERERDKKEAIREHFHVNFFLALQATQAGQRTAFEVSELQGEKAAILGSSIGRMYRALDQVIDFAFWNELNAGRLPQPPEILLQAGASIDTVYLGPLAQTQKRLFANTGIRRGMEEVLPLVEFFPGVLDNFNGDEIARELATGSGMPEKLFIERVEVAKTREIRRAKQEQDEALAQLGELGSISKDAASAQKDSSQVVEAGEELASDVAGA